MFVGGDKRFSTYDGLSRRDLVRMRFLGLGGLTLPNLLVYQAQASATSHSSKAVIYIELAGGPTQFETYDPKPKSPTEYREQLLKFIAITK